MQSAPRNHGPPQVEGPFISFSITQHNSLGSWDVFLSLMNSLTSLDPHPMVVAIQDPPVRNGRLPRFSSFKCLHPPHKRPRVAFYLHPHLIGSTSVLPVSSPRPDLMSIDLFAPGGFFEFSFTRLRLTNAYNLPCQQAPFRSLSPQDLFVDLSFPTLIMGDFNLH